MSKTKNEIWSVIVFVLLGLAALVGIAYGLLSKRSTPLGRLGRNIINMDTLSSPIDSTDLETEGHYDLREGEIYLVTVNGDSAFVDIQDVHGAHLEGNIYYLKPGATMVNAVPYDFVTRLFSNRLIIGDKEYSFQHSNSELRGFVDGQEHIVTGKDDKTYRFKAVSYTQPAFATLIDHRYQRPLYKTRVIKDIIYGQSEGYWTENGWDNAQSYTKILFEGIRNTINYRILPLKMDVYMPITQDNDDGGESSQQHPLILFIHGGAYYVGDKADKAIVEWCNYFTSLGYVCASIDYRMGFFPTKEEIERAGYMAAQDANAAMRFLVHNADRYNIDPDNLFAAGCSAGAITALNLTFMSESDRPQSSYGYGSDGRKALALAKSRQSADNDDDTIEEKEDDSPSDDSKKNNVKRLLTQYKQIRTQRKQNKINKDNLGSLTASGNAINERFHIRAIANMWGAVNNLDELQNSRTDIISFHGNADKLVPYDKGYPFQDADNKLGQHLIGNLYGSAAITARAQSLGLRASLNTFPNMGHAPHLNPDRSINRRVFNLIRDSITSFFYTEMVPQPACIAQDANNVRHFFILSPQVSRVMWQVEGGFILQTSPRSIWVVWIKGAPIHRIQASGLYENGIAFNTHREI